jgi:hypothetical protein
VEPTVIGLLHELRRFVETGKAVSFSSRDVLSVIKD